MKILILDIDSKIDNFALKKIEKYHLNKGDEVIWNNELFKNTVDKIYVSCVFDWNKDNCKEWEGRAEIGGSGYSLERVLPPEIEEVKPHINLGFTSRGCIRKCPFCLTPDSLILSENGAKRIDTIKIGERVLTHTGKYREVKSIFRRPFKGNVVQLDNGAISRLFPTKITEEHP